MSQCCQSFFIIDKHIMAVSVIASASCFVDSDASKQQNLQLIIIKIIRKICDGNDNKRCTYIDTRSSFKKLPTF